MREGSQEGVRVKRLGQEEQGRKRKGDSRGSQEASTGENG